MVVVRIASRRLVKNPGGADHGFGGGLVAGRVAQETRLELVGAEEPLHTRVVVHDQGAHEMPVPGLIEAKDSSARGREAEAEAIEPHPPVPVDGKTACVPGEKQQIGVAPRTVGEMPRVRAAMGGR